MENQFNEPPSSSNFSEDFNAAINVVNSGGPRVVGVLLRADLDDSMMSGDEDLSVHEHRVIVDARARTDLSNALRLVMNKAWLNRELHTDTSSASDGLNNIIDRTRPETIARRRARAALSQEQRDSVNAARRQARASMTPEQRKAHRQSVTQEQRENRAAASREARSLLSQEQRDSMNSARRQERARSTPEQRNARRQSVTQEQRENRAAASREARSSLSQEQRHSVNAARRQTRARRTQEERANRNEVLQNARANRSVSQHKADNQSQRTARENLPQEVRAVRHEAQQVRTAGVREQMTDQEREQQRQNNSTRMRNERESMRNAFSEATARSWPGQSPTPILLGDRNDPCAFGCGALHFRDTSTWICCTKGQIRLGLCQRLNPYPDDMMELLLEGHPHSGNFFEYIRRFNSAPPPGHGPYCFRIHGSIYYRSGLLHPQSPDQQRRYGQIYILEGDRAAKDRLNMPINAQAPRDVMFLLSRTLSEVNPYASAYRNVHAVEQQELAIAGVQGREPQQICMVFSAGPDRRRYNRPNYCDVAAVFVGQDEKPGPQEF